jgi:SnoaL-like domain
VARLSRGGKRRSLLTTRLEDEVDGHEFADLMRTIERAWSTGDAAAAAACFTEDAVYVEPPDRQRYAGRDELFELSGGDDPPPMSMTWHHVVFDPAQQVGVGEYTFRGRRQFHGMAIVHVEGGKIRRWREYQYESEADWLDFVGHSRF